MSRAPKPSPRPAVFSAPSRIRTLLCCVAVVVAGCTGATHAEPGQGPIGAANVPNDSGPDATTCSETASLAPARVWVLTDEQYVNVISDVFGVTLAGADAEISTTRITNGTYANRSEARMVDVAAATGYRSAAEKVARAVQPCAEGANPACVEDFVRNRVARAWRRPLEEAEVQRFMSLFSENAASADPGSAARLVLEAALQAGSFLYRTELGVNAASATTPITLTPHEIASALSFLAYDSAPDDELWAKASDGSLAEPAVLSAEVDRLLAMPRTRRNLTRLVGYWSGAELLWAREKETTVFPEYTETLKASLHRSLTAFLDQVVWSGSFADIYLSRTLHADEELAAVYGLPSPGGEGMALVETPSQRPAAGLLTHPAFLSATNKRMRHDDPIHRGLFIFSSLACGNRVADPPAGALEAAADMSGTERELAEQRAATPACAGCHHLFDPLGLALEHFDPIGRYRDQGSDGTPIDSSTVVSGLGTELDGPVTGVSDLAQRFATSERAAQCASGVIASYLLGHTNTSVSCELRARQNQFARTGSFAGFFRELLTAPGFVRRSPGLE